MKVLILVMFFLMSQSCKKDDIKNDPVKEVPILVSSTPSDKETSVSLKITEAELIFKDDIAIVSSSLIKLNGAPVPDVTTNGKKLIVELPILNKETIYILSLEAMSVKSVGGGVNTDEISISFTTGKKPEIVISPNLAVFNPSPEAVNVYNFLKDNYGKKIVSSAMANVSWNMNEAEWVYQHTGKYPAIATFDYIHHISSPSGWIDYSDVSLVGDWWNNNGLVSAAWHWNVPASEGATNYDFYSSGTSFSAENAVISGTWENAVVLADLEEIAGYLKLLKAKNIPVIWRPLHEAAGNIYEFANGKAWFWWGNDGAEAYKALWIYMFDYFENEGLNNLIWVWTTQTKDNAFYPGDDYVDIIGRDIYDEQNVSSIAGQFVQIQELYNNKMVTLSECGGVSNISDQWSVGAKWSCFMPWYDHDRTKDVNSAAFSSTDHAFANVAWWADAFAQDVVITRDEMPDLK